MKWLPHFVKVQMRAISRDVTTFRIMQSYSVLTIVIIYSLLLKLSNQNPGTTQIQTSCIFDWIISLWSSLQLKNYMSCWVRYHLFYFGKTIYEKIAHQIVIKNVPMYRRTNTMIHSSVAEWRKATRSRDEIRVLFSAI